MKIVAFLLLLFIALSTANNHHANEQDADKVTVRFYGEALCPFCRMFVTQVWQPIWDDLELRQYIDYDFIPWGNAYFATEFCGVGPYNSQECRCWYQHCIITQSDDEKACFESGKAVYQHGEKEGQMDIYESCIKTVFGLDMAVKFTYCAEGPKMDDKSMDAKELMTACGAKVIPNFDVETVQECFNVQGRKLEIRNAKQTPEHPGVPFVVIDGSPIDDATETKDVICKNLKAKGLDPIPKACQSGTRNFLRLNRTSK